MNPPSTLTRFLSVWPKLNKQDCIDGYLDQIRERNFEVDRAVVAETVCLTCDEFHEFTHNLLEDRDWLAGKGGFTARGVRSVLLVCRPGEAEDDRLGIYVDPQGFNYARYVGFYLQEAETTRIVTRPPGIPGIMEAMPTTLNGVSLKDRIFAEAIASHRQRTQPQPA